MGGRKERNASGARYAASSGLTKSNILRIFLIGKHSQTARSLAAEEKRSTNRRICHAAADVGASGPPG